MRKLAELLLWTAGLGSTADSPATALLRETVKKVKVNSENLPNYTCVQNIVRMQYAPALGVRSGSCPALVASRMANRKELGTKMFQDRLRLDVAVVDNREMFGWAGAKQFETNEIDTLIPGTSGSGDFGSFLNAAFGPGIARYVYKGEEETDIGSLAKFFYEIPVDKSRYRMRMDKDFATVGYRGTFYVDPKESDIRRLVIEADEFPPAARVCRVVDTMDYRRVRMGDHDFLLPETTSMEVLFESGQTSLNETQYSGCRQYVGESTIRYDDVEDQKITAEEKKEAETPLPAKVHLSLALTGAVDLYRASAGDPITAVTTRDVVKSKKLLVRANTKLHGRLIRVEQDFPPRLPHWVIGISFETIERAGQEQPIRLDAIDDGFRSRMPQPNGRMRDQMALMPRHEKNSGAGIFIFPTSENPKLDSSFRSEWQVVEPPAEKQAPPTGAAPQQ